MKLGLHVSSQSVETGGGYTLENDLLQALLTPGIPHRHEIALIGQASEKPSALADCHLPWLSLHRSAAERRRQRWDRFRRRARKKLGLKNGPRPLDHEAFPTFRGRQPDLIFYLAPGVRPIADLPYVTMVWDLEHRTKPFFPEVGIGGEWEARERRYREILPRAAYVLALGSHDTRRVREMYGVPAERIRAVTLPTPRFALEAGSETDAATALEQLGVRGDFLFYPAQFWAHKNHIVLLLALRELGERHGYCPQLVLTGSDKGNRAFVEQRTRELGLGDQVIFPGFVSREELVALYRQAIALVFPSFCEPENLPPLEALALGCPVVATLSSGHQEQLGEAALLANPTRPEAWAEAILRLRPGQPLRGEQIARGRVRATTHTAADFLEKLWQIADEFELYRRCWPAGS